jgi:REP element-mobilizing transposase RayT
MSRPLRLQFPGAVYHVTARGNAGQAIFADDTDRTRFLELLEREIEQQRWRCHAYCLMGNHYHLLIETPEANLSRGMARLNMTYAQGFNRRHERLGHLFQGRYKAIVVAKDSHLLELCRYLVLNPVRAGLVESPAGWRWSSYRATASAKGTPDWLTTRWILRRFDAQDGRARRAYRRFVAEGMDAASPWRNLRAGAFLGGEAFLRAMRERASRKSSDQIPAAARRPDRPSADEILAAVAKAARVAPEGVLDRRTDQAAFRVAVYLLRRVANLPLKEVAGLAGVSAPRVSQIQRRIEDAGGLGRAFPWAAKLARKYKVKF